MTAETNSTFPDPKTPDEDIEVVPGQEAPMGDENEVEEDDDTPPDVVPGSDADTAPPAMALSLTP